MPVYRVVRKSDSVEIYRYFNDIPVEWNGMEFANFDHVPVVEVNADGSIEGVVTSRILTKLEYLRRFTQDERIVIRQAAKANTVLEDYLALLELAQEIDTADADTIAAVNMLEQAGLLATGRAQEILNG